jgi:hypothetical protein
VAIQTAFQFTLPRFRKPTHRLDCHVASRLAMTRLKVSAENGTIFNFQPECLMSQNERQCLTLTGVDTNFICLANFDQYPSFVSEDWDEENRLKAHVHAEQKKGNILMFQITAEGIEADWQIEISFAGNAPENCFKSATGYLNVTHGRVGVLDYDLLTMAAQFEDESILDNIPPENIFLIENGVYEIHAFLLTNVDVENDELIGNLRLVFERVPVLPDIAPGIFWSTGIL